MRRIVSLVALVMIAVATAGAQANDSTPLPTIQLPPELARVLTDYETQWRIGGDSLARLFTEDAILTVGGRPPARGRAAIAAHYAGSHGPLALRAIAFAAEGNVAYIIGGYTSQRGQPDVGKFVLTLRKVDGRWLIFSDMDTGNSPMRRPGSWNVPDHISGARHDPQTDDGKLSLGIEVSSRLGTLSAESKKTAGLLRNHRRGFVPSSGFHGAPQVTSKDGEKSR